MTLPSGKALPDREFTARDVKFTFDCILNPHIDAAHIRNYYEDPDARDASQKYRIKVSVVDNYSVKVKWSQPYFLAPEFTLAIPMIPRHVFSVNEKGEPISLDFSSKEFAEGFNSHWANRRMCSTGPMMFVEWVKDEKLVLKRNPDYWGEPFYFEQAIFRNIPNTNTARQEVLQNRLDWVVIPEKDLYTQLKEHDSVSPGKVKLGEYEYPGYCMIGYNLRRDFFKDKRVRQALSHACGQGHRGSVAEPRKAHDRPVRARVERLRHQPAAHSVRPKKGRCAP
jgi:ABC-type transport system substrate-binding protein